ncbi:MAG: type II secretion system protein GspL [Pseudomonadota bacterium]
MARIYALLQPDGSLLVARARGSGWAVGTDLRGIETRGRNLTVFLNGLDVLGVKAAIPARNENEARRAAPFAVEDDIAEGVDESHVVLADLDKDNPGAARELNVVSNDAMRQTLAVLAGLDLHEAEIMAAHSLLPDQDILFEAPGLVLGRLGDRGFAIDASLGRDVLISLSEAHSDILIHGQQVAQALGRSAAKSGAGSLEEFLTQLAIWAEDGRGIRLRQGAFEAKRPIDLEGMGRWKFVGALAAVTALGWFASVVLETNAMNTRAQKLDNLAVEFANVGWPEVNGDVRQALAAAGVSDGETAKVFPSILDASAIIYGALAQIEGSELRTLRYDRARRQITATVAFQSFADVDRLTALLNTSGLSARSGDSRQSGTRVIGDLTLENAS